MLRNIIPFKGTSPTIAKDAFIAPSAFVIGDTVIGEGSSIWFNCVVRGDVHSIRIGKRTNIQDGTVIHVSGGTHSTTIGDDVLVGHNCLIHGCTLENGSFVGMGAIVLDGAVVETGAMVAAGALVTPGKRVPSGELWGGSPAKCLRKLTDEQKADLTSGAHHYAELAQVYRAEQG
ncbi:gamma carbonic anhydrase family protein [Sneathiella sp. HT1-7]|jgi:carbonic anhydrase/acetyltransferase-like protein (isoleucine patch superfamily)|uniref:gamma carbonic anhydrase family protein n=1 Tax=Sneathiella sp. HT1-7 TaxID=2887192 RepID=UPI001D147448|nr:gamma carbonic anhydrase family protein [Sneathiella sp. HT1-7]MCC3304806.1 gamma carbonic anhydrase family protein [Sneathiella sp. HT1-7]